MSSINEITAVTLIAGTTGSGRKAVASCLLGSGFPTSLAAFAQVSGRFGGARVSRVVFDRPTWASAAEAAQTSGYAFAADGAGHRIRPANADTTVKLQQHRKMWAFRGLEPWRDPA